MAVAGALATKIVRNHSPLPPRSHSRSPHLESLVDYDDDDEPVSIDITDFSAALIVPPSSPKPSHRQIPSSPTNGPPPKRLPSVDEEEEDNMLEALVSRSRPQSPAPGMMANLNSFGSMRPGEKRRRDEDDEDGELLERLSKKTRSRKAEGSAFHFVK